MTVIIKTHRHQPGSWGRTIQLEERAQKGTAPVVGERVFVWTAETLGGDGLCLRGEITHVHRMQSGRTRLTIRRDARPVTTPLRMADLAPFRTIRDGSPIAMLAGKLYYQAHNKIAALSSEEEAFLDGFFDTLPLVMPARR